MSVLSSRIILAAPFFICMLAFCSITYAEETSSTNTLTSTSTKPVTLPRKPMEVKQNMKANMGRGAGTTTKPINERLMENKERAQAQFAERRAALGEKMKERFKHLFGNAKEKCTAFVERLTKIADRIDERAEKLKAEGVNTTETEEFVDTARAELTSALTLINGSLDTEITETIESESPRERFMIAREKFKEVREHIRKAHESLKSAIASLKKAAAAAGISTSRAVERGSENRSASSTIN